MVPAGTPRIRFSRDGNQVAHVEGDRIRLVGVPNLAPSCAIRAPQLIDFAFFEDQLWLVTGPAPRLRSFRLSGKPLCDPVDLPVGAPGRLVAAPLGPPSAVWLGGQAARVDLDGDGLRVAPEGQFDLAMPIDADSMFAVRRQTLWIHRDSEWAVQRRELPGVAVDGCALFEGRTVAVLTEGDGRQHLLIIGSNNGGLRYRMRLRGITAVRFAPRGGYAVLRGGMRRLLVVDLRLGKMVQEYDEDREIDDFAVDDDAQHLVLRVREAGEPRTLYTSFHSLLTLKSGAGLSSPGTADDEDSSVVDVAEEAPSVLENRTAIPPILETPEEDEAALEEDESWRDLPVPGRLSPVPTLELCSRTESLRTIDAYLELVGAWAGYAIASAWDSGRLSRDESPLPLASEVAGILQRNKGAASSELAIARTHVEAAQARVTSQEQSLGRRVWPLRALAEELSLSPLASAILMVVAAPSLWGELARLYAIVGGNSDRAACDELLVGQILGYRRAFRAKIARELDPDQPLSRFGLVRTAAAAERPFAGLSAATAVLRRLRGDPIIPAPGVTVRPANRSLPEILAPRAAVRQLLESLASTGGPARVVARGRLGSGRRTLLAAVAAAANRRLGMVDFQLLAASSRIDQLRSLLRECHLSGMLPCIDGLPGARALEDVERDRLAELLRSHPGPLAFRMPLETSPPLDPGYLAIDLPPLGDAARLRLWRRAIETHRLAVNDVEALAARFRVGPGVVEHVVNEVARTAPGDRGERDQTGAVVAALRQHVEVRLSSVAERIPRLPTWSSVILSEEVADRLRELVARARHRRIVFDEWGYDRQASSGRGLTALFQGPPGTGKTLAAGLLARELGLELYRIDLSRIVSKWIGETEQNLATAFDAAEDGQAVILFDEADSLFARRTEVKTSVDRYANLEVNYLLSRLDSFGGIAILTTNLSGSIDRAFKRRLSMRLHFPFPDEEMRAKLWRVHLPPEAPIGDELDFSDLASRYRVSGGYIRNAALRAAFLAAADGSALTIEHFERAIRLEYIEVGKLTDAGVLE